MPKNDRLLVDYQQSDYLSGLRAFHLPGHNFISFLAANDPSAFPFLSLILPVAFLPFYVSLLDKSPVKELLANPDYNNVKELRYNQLTINLF
jgi:hypothetical protein